ncbi:hypothetical protein [Ferviditalea candida]|uniref:Uncharacterized protein n=1 Tax=Ferviditalea candida TaxID=3108399 RepID=A0ABU5ZLI1_9BACL|nr:hypothetical protein [Paenibacillaceae bacterium T2]
MRIAYIAVDSLLSEQWMKSQAEFGCESVFFEDTLGALEDERRGEWDVLVLSDRCVPLADIGPVIDGFRGLSESLKVIILLSNHHDTDVNDKYMKACIANQVEYIAPGRSVQAVVNEIHRLIFGAVAASRPQRNSTVLFLGTTPNIGATTASFGTAVQLARRTGLIIGYLCLNLKSSKLHRYLGIEQPRTTLDGIRAEIKSMSLNESRLLQLCERLGELPNLSILFGNMLREQAEYYTPEDIEYLLQLAERTFDLCVIGVGAYWDNSATVCSALFADTKIVVTTPQLSHFQEDFVRWAKNMIPVFGLNTGEFDLLITQSESMGGEGFHAKEIGRETGLQVIGELRKYGYLDSWLNRGKLLELMLHHPELSGDLQRPTTLLMKLFGLPEVKTEEKGAGWLKRWFSAQRSRIGTKVVMKGGK